MSRWKSRARVRRYLDSRNLSFATVSSPLSKSYDRSYRVCGYPDCAIKQPTVSVPHPDGFYYSTTITDLGKIEFKWKLIRENCTRLLLLQYIYCWWIGNFQITHTTIESTSSQGFHTILQYKAPLVCKTSIRSTCVWLTLCEYGSAASEEISVLIGNSDRRRRRGWKTVCGVRYYSSDDNDDKTIGANINWYNTVPSQAVNLFSTTCGFIY